MLEQWDLIELSEDSDAEQILEALMLITERHPSPLATRALKIFHKLILNFEQKANYEIFRRNFSYSLKNVQRLGIKVASEDKTLKDLAVELIIFFLNHFEQANMLHFTDNIELIESIHWEDRRRQNNILEEMQRTHSLVNKLRDQLIDALSKSNEKIQELDKRQQENNQRVFMKLSKFEEDAETAKEDSKRQLALVQSAFNEKIDKSNMALSETNSQFAKKISEIKEESKRTVEIIEENLRKLEAFKDDQKSQDDKIKKKIDELEKETIARLKRKALKLRHEATNTKEEIEKLIEMQKIQEFKETVQETSRLNHEKTMNEMGEIEQKLLKTIEEMAEKVEENQEKNKNTFAEISWVKKLEEMLNGIEAKGLDGKLEESKKEGNRQKDKRKVLKKEFGKVKEELREFNGDTSRQLESLKEEITKLKEELEKSQKAHREKEEKLAKIQEELVERRQGKGRKEEEKQKMKEKHKEIENEIEELKRKAQEIEKLEGKVKKIKAREKERMNSTNKSSVEDPKEAEGKGNDAFKAIDEKYDASKAELMELGKQVSEMDEKYKRKIKKLKKTGENWNETRPQSGDVSDLARQFQEHREKVNKKLRKFKEMRIKAAGFEPGQSTSSPLGFSETNPDMMKSIAILEEQVRELHHFHNHQVLGESIDSSKLKDNSLKKLKTHVDTLNGDLKSAIDSVLDSRRLVTAEQLRMTFEKYINHNMSSMEEFKKKIADSFLKVHGNFIKQNSFNDHVDEDLIKIL